MENKLNLPPFYIGQKVVYITGNNMPKGSIHTVTGIKQMVCGCWDLFINNEPPWKLRATTQYLECTECGIHIPNTIENCLYGWDANSFRAIEEIKASIMTLSQIKETEREEILLNN